MISGPNGAAGTWHQLAILSHRTGKPEAAEMWYRKVIKGFRGSSHQVSLAMSLCNLANLLLNLPGRLAEARQLAEEALAIDKKLDPGAAEIWKTYDFSPRSQRRRQPRSPTAAPRRNSKTRQPNIGGLPAKRNAISGHTA